MDRSDFCGCKGVRTCIKCEKEFGYENKNIVEFTDDTYVYCPYCNKAWQGSDMNGYQSHPNHTGKCFDIDGVYIQEDFLSPQEAEDLLTTLDELPWDKSQSGRRKQNFGPKCNFKRQKIKLGDFQGFPASTKFIQDRFEQDSVLKNFQTIEQCTLEYDSSNGSSIDNHIDDCWIWGERIVTVNVVGDSVLTLTYYNGDSNKYNLNCGCYSYKKKYSNQHCASAESGKENKEPIDAISCNAKSNNFEKSTSNPPTNSTDGSLSEKSCQDLTADVTKNQTLGEKSTINRISSGEQSTLNHISSEKTTLNQISSEKSILNHNASEKTSLNHISNEKSTLNNNSSEKTTLDHSSDEKSTFNHSSDCNAIISNPTSADLSSVVIRIPMPARSLLVLYGEARYEWQHCVLRSDVIGRRVCIAYREFTTPYLSNAATLDVFEKAKCFF